MAADEIEELIDVEDDDSGLVEPEDPTSLAEDLPAELDDSTDDEAD